MERVKDLNQLIIQEDTLLIKIVEKNSLIVQAEGNGPMIDYSIVILKGDKVTRYNIGDIILRMTLVTLEVHEYKGDKYALIPEGFVKIAVDPNNFDRTIITGKSKLDIN